MPGEGGQGAEPGNLTREDLAMIGRAIRAEWKIPQTVLDALPSQIAKMFVEQKSPRAKMAAARLLVLMQSENRSTAHLALQSTQGQNPLVTVNNNVTVGAGDQKRVDIDRVAEIAAELRRIGVSFGESVDPIQPAQTDAETGGIPDAGENEPIP